MKATLIKATETMPSDTAREYIIRRNEGAFVPAMIREDGNFYSVDYKGNFSHLAIKEETEWVKQ